jgi:hypothetical protein
MDASMKSKLKLALGALVAFLVTANGQGVEALNQVTLYSRTGQGDLSRSSVNFDTGARGSTIRDPNGFDLMYGNLQVNDDNNWFEVSNPRSTIVDLGKKKWEKLKGTPSFPKSKKPRKPLPLSGNLKEINVSAGVKEVSPYQQFVRVKLGHMYLMKVVRDGKKTYVLFRVDTLTKQENCVLTWKKVQPPPEDIEK